MFPVFGVLYSIPHCGPLKKLSMLKPSWPNIRWCHIEHLQIKYLVISLLSWTVSYREIQRFYVSYGPSLSFSFKKIATPSKMLVLIFFFVTGGINLFSFSWKEMWGIFVSNVSWKVWSWWNSEKVTRDRTWNEIYNQCSNKNKIS